MEFGLLKDEVKLVPYDLRWKSEFEKAKPLIMQHTKLQSHQIQHIGSTSIVGIYAKPIIDILVGVENLSLLQPQFYKDLQQAGFYRLRVERENEIVCAKFTDHTFEKKTHFIHIVDIAGEKWKQMLFFRDYLNTNENVRKEYEALKKSFFQTSLKGIGAYTEYKERFVQMIYSKMEEI